MRPLRSSLPLAVSQLRTSTRPIAAASQFTFFHLRLSPHSTPASHPRSLHTSHKMTTEATVRTFFTSPNFAVVGASSNPDKYGHKVFAWYTAHSLPVTPINPGTPEISVSGDSSSPHKTVPSLSALPDPKQTSVSIITPPKATIAVLREARELGIPAVWMQPGSFNDEVLAYARSDEAGFKGVVAGDGGRGGEGWCILVDGERGLKAAGKL